MKCTKFWSSVICILGLTIILGACSDDNGGESDKKLVLSVNPASNKIEANGTDQAVFTVKLGAQDVTSSAVITRDGSATVTNATFTTTEEGSYVFKATYDGKSSNEITITASKDDGGTQERTDFKKTVAIHQLTSTSCEYCPPMKDAIAAAKGKYGDDIIPMSYHGTMNPAKPDPFFIRDAGQYMNTYPVIGWPSALFDLQYTFASYSDFDKYIPQQLAEIPKAGLRILNSQISGEAINVRVEACAAEEDEYRLTILVIQDGLVASQFKNGAGWLDDYVHDYVVRDRWPNREGQPLGLMQPKETKTSIAQLNIPASADEKLKFIESNARVVAYITSKKTVKGVDYWGVDNIVEAPIGQSTEYKYRN